MDNVMIKITIISIAKHELQCRVHIIVFLTVSRLSDMGVGKFPCSRGRDR